MYSTRRLCYHRGVLSYMLYNTTLNSEPNYTERLDQILIYARCFYFGRELVFRYTAAHTPPTPSSLPPPPTEMCLFRFDCRRCWCGLATEDYTLYKDLPSSCGYRCAGDSSALCGGYTNMNVFSIDGELPLFFCGAYMSCAIDTNIERAKLTSSPAFCRKKVERSVWDTFSLMTGDISVPHYQRNDKTDGVATYSNKT